VETDPDNKAGRRLLNLGHMIGGAAEQYYNFNDAKLTHGEGTAVGMYLTTKRSEMLGVTKRGTAARIEYVLRALGLPTELDIPADGLLPYLAYDKHMADDVIRLPVLEEIGKGVLREVTKEEIEKIHAHAMSSAKK